MPNPLWTLHIGSAQHVGRRRRGRPNEDAMGIDIPWWPSRRPPLLVVADGMGGHLGGATASHLVVNTVLGEYRRSRTGDDPLHALDVAIRAAHEALRKKAKRDPEKLGNMGSTIVAAVVTEDRVNIANVGDSRAYLVHGGRIVQLSLDHSQVAELERSGDLEAAAKIRGEKGRSSLTMSLNAQRETIKIHLESAPLEPGDTVVLCSDGLWGQVSDAEIYTVVTELELQAAADKLVSLANISQGPDNITVIVAKLVPRDGALDVQTTSDAEVEEDTGPGPAD